MKTFWGSYLVMVLGLIGISARAQQPDFSRNFATAEAYLDTDQIEKSQQALNKAKEFLDPKEQSDQSYYVLSLQSELYYYLGLYQFGLQEGDKALQLAKRLHNDLFIADAYFFRGINLFELKSYHQSEASLWQSDKHFPKTGIGKQPRALVKPEYIYNNLAQAKLQLHEADSAYFYNQKAYGISRLTNSRRGIPNAEQTFGLIELERHDPEKARAFFDRCIQSSLDSRYYDLTLLGYAYRMRCYEKGDPAIRGDYEKGLDLMARTTVNPSFQRLFMVEALKAFRQFGDLEQIVGLQDRIIAIDAETSQSGNLHLQDISNQYVQNENKLMGMQVRELNRQRNLVLLELVAALLCVLVLILAVLAFRRKNRLQRALLEQKNDISQDLHDDIGSGLSSILIHADLLQRAPETSDKDKAMAARIETTASEISQRLHTFIWSLNNQNDTLQDFCEYVKQYAFKLFENIPMQLEYHQEIDELQYALNGKIRKNLFYCVKEILNNALKHSGATQLRLTLYKDRKYLQIIIADNGVGLQGGNAFGNGLNNLKRRLQAIGGELEIRNNDGLTVRLSLPVS